MQLLKIEVFVRSGGKPAVYVTGRGTDGSIYHSGVSESSRVDLGNDVQVMADLMSDLEKGSTTPRQFHEVKTPASTLRRIKS